MRNILVAFLVLVSVLSCKKDKDSGGSGNVSNALKDSTLSDTREIYLWYKNIPENFNARQYDDPNKIMEAIRPFSIETGFSNPVDRWSFAMKKKEWDDLSSGVSEDFGLNVFFFSANDLRVSYVERESPAGKAGIRRSWRITKINNNSNITTSNATDIANSIFNSDKATITFNRAAGDTTVTLNATSYKEHPIALDSVYSNSGNKTGYFVFNSFLGDTTEIKSEFTRIFNRFNSEAVKDVVLDLRYNGGGYVNLQSLLANYLVPTAGNNQVMLTEQFNDKYASLNETTKFSKKGSLNLSRLFVIVSQNTASASELLINSLKPFMNVILVGPSKTHGKPVGFFPIPEEDWYIFPVSFRTVNKNGQGNYFDGMALNYQIGDGLDKSFGDVNENCLGSALAYIRTGAFTGPRAIVSEDVENGNTRIGAKKLKVLIDTKRKL